MKLVKSPLNYHGGKYKLLPQILPLFPEGMKIFVDVFGGGFNVGANVEADTVVYNEYERNVCEIIHGMLTNSDIVHEIDCVISKYNLTKENTEGYLACREDWNNKKYYGGNKWLHLYVLICYSFNNSIRFNSKGEFNVAFGKNKSSFNTTLKNRFLDFKERIKGIDLRLYNEDFRKIMNNKGITKDCFFYCDPPYLITTANYNENGGWTEKDEVDLLESLDKLNEKGNKFALSNVLEHKGKSNDLLKEWSKKYKVHYLNHSYSNCSYHGKNTDKPTIEVLITNY